MWCVHSYYCCIGIISVGTRTMNLNHKSTAVSFYPSHLRHRLTPALLTSFPPHAQILRKHGWSNPDIRLIFSARNGHVSDSYNKTNLTAAAYTRSFNDRRMYRLRDRYRTFAKATCAFWMQAATSSATVSLAKYAAQICHFPTCPRVSWSRYNSSVCFSNNSFFEIQLIFW